VGRFPSIRYLTSDEAILGSNSFGFPEELEGFLEKVYECDADPELARVFTAWTSLPTAIKAGILAMVRASDRPQPAILPV
jgi:hypothetical protein